EHEKLEQFNEFLAECRADGTLETLTDKWTGDDEAAKKLRKYDLKGTNGTLHVSAVPEMQPMSYINDEGLTGYAVELTLDFAEKYGYDVEFEPCSITSAITGITSGKYDILAGTCSVTEERKQSMDFSDTFYRGGMTALIRTEDISGGSYQRAEVSLYEQIKSGIEKNFIREKRWKLIVQGIGTTCFITVMTVLFGTVLAFLVCMFRRTGSRLANIISNLYVRLLQGTPMVVLLMILYYVVFGRSGLPSVWVAIIGFTLNFGAYVSEIMRSGIESIDDGQREAALALGYTENSAFFKFIFPQAALRQMPVYRGEVVSLLKSTSIVGYIAIQDLTKMSDIIRSRTYEAFFPLIVTAVIYFILAWILTLIIRLSVRLLDRRNRKHTVKEAV
ncbi:MAG TPA: ABC transporter substrate-binding protein, partial [Ruminococcus sp.]|nr:ABC transporter substrate-binding protein [Ruminococcus sp.]